MISLTSNLIDDKDKFRFLLRLIPFISPSLGIRLRSKEKHHNCVQNKGEKFPRNCELNDAEREARRRLSVQSMVYGIKYGQVWYSIARLLTREETKRPQAAATIDTRGDEETVAEAATIDASKVEDCCGDGSRYFVDDIELLIGVLKVDRS